MRMKGKGKVYLTMLLIRMMHPQLAADRHSSNESPEELQKKTAAHAEEKHK